MGLVFSRSVTASPTFTVSPRTHGALGRLTWCVPGCQSMLEPCHTLSKLCLEPSAVGLTKFSQVGKLRHHPLQATGMPTRLGSVAAGECDLPACKTSVAMFSSTQASLG